jgi:hypothetical protein
VGRIGKILAGDGPMGRWDDGMGYDGMDLPMIK